jgi:hypothetical protein
MDRTYIDTKLPQVRTHETPLRNASITRSILEAQDLRYMRNRDSRIDIRP